MITKSNWAFESPINESSQSRSQNGLKMVAWLALDLKTVLISYFQILSKQKPGTNACVLQTIMGACVTSTDF